MIIRIFLLISILGFASCRVLSREDGSSVSPVLCMKKEWNNFIKDKRVKFLCKIPAPSKNLTVTWMIRDPVTLVKAFLTSDGKDVILPEKVDESGTAEMELPMRNDFSKMEVVCRTSDGKEASYTLPKIKSAASLEVTVGNTDVTEGEPIQLWCDVRGEFDVEAVNFFFGKNIYKATGNRTIQASDDGARSKPCDNIPIGSLHCSNMSAKHCETVRRFYYNSSEVWPEKLSDSRIQCLVRHSGSKRADDYLRSSLRNIIVHYVKVLPTAWENITIKDGMDVNLTFEIKANPELRRNAIKVVRLQNEDEHTIVETVRNVRTHLTRVGEDQISVNIIFFPNLPGNYRVDFHMKTSVFSTPIFGVNVTFLRFLTPLLDRRVSKGDSLLLNFTFAANPKPTLHDIFVVGRSGDSQDIRPVSVSNGHLAKMGNFVYTAEFTFTPKSSGVYFVKFQNQSIPSINQRFSLTFGPKSGSSRQKMELLLPILIFIIVCYTVVVLLLLIVPRLLNGIKRQNMMEWIREHKNQEPVDFKTRAMTVVSQQEINQSAIELIDGGPEPPIPVKVRLPGCDPKTFDLTNEDSIQDILEKIMNDRPKFQVLDIKLGDSSIIEKSSLDWASITVQECDFPENGELVIQPRFPKKFRISVRKADSSELFKSRTYPTDRELMDSEWQWSAMMAYNKRIFLPNTISFQWGMDYKVNNRKQSAWECFDEYHFTSYFANEDEGQEVSLDRAKHLIISFLVPKSTLRFPGEKIPTIDVYQNCDLLRMTNDGKMSEIKKPDSLFGNRWLAFIRGMRCTRPGREETFFVLSNGRNYFSSESGAIFADETAVAKSKVSVENIYWRRFFLLMRENDVLPAAKVPSGKTVSVFRRDGVHLMVEKYRLQKIDGGVEDNSCVWKLPTQRKKFDNDFGKAMKSQLRLTR